MHPQWLFAIAMWIDHPLERGLINCDWLCLSVKLPRPFATITPGEHKSWQLYPLRGTNVFDYRAYVLDDSGNKVATLLFSPKSPVIDARCGLIEVANRYLYCGDTRETLDELLAFFPFAVSGINRLDIACDFELSRHYWDVVQGLASSSMYVARYRRGVTWWQDAVAPSGRQARVPHCLTFGSPQSALTWKLYWKWLELDQAPVDAKKPYITNAWREFGLREQYVWRLEMSLRGTNGFVALDGHTKPWNWWIDNLIPIYCGQYSSGFVVRQQQGHVDKRRDAVVDFLCVDGERMLAQKTYDGDSMHSDAQRRVTCKLWAELMNPDVWADRYLREVIRQQLAELFQFESNLNAVCRRFGLSPAEVAHAYGDC